MIVIGSIALKQAGSFDGDPIAVFMSCSFVLLTILEILLLRQLSRELEARRLTAPEREKTLPLPGVRRELQPSNVNSLPEPVSSVTENTTRTLGYTSRD
jgi:hypothetical protein